MGTAEALVMGTKDSVATALIHLETGQRVVLRLGEIERVVVLQQPIPAGHKFALELLAPGDAVIKYGEVIGTATAPIAPGEHVHIHNVSGNRGRGDARDG